MSFYDSDAGGEGRFQALASLPLPEAAVVIDVRHADPHTAPLLEYLLADIGDLATEMRLHEVPRWRFLAECIDVLRVDGETLPTEFTDFTLTTRTGKQIPAPGPENLARLLGRDYLDRVRNARIRAIQDSGGNIEMPLPELTDPERPTVRVLFLADMDEHESLTRAATYAQWLKEWNELSHGPRRSSRDECIQTTVICMNADATSYSETLLSTLGQLPDTAVDTVILLQTYSDDEAYIGGEVQSYQAELIIYTLLLHWPEVFQKTIDDPYTASRQGVSGATMLPWPTYTLGIAALEYSARWSARWLDYGVEAKLLELLRDAKKVEQDDTLITANIQKWLRNWWQEVRDIVPTSMTTTVDELQVFDSIQGLLSQSAFVRSAPGTTLAALDTFRQQVGARYTGADGMTLQRAMGSAPMVSEHFKWMYTRSQREENEQDVVDEAYNKVAQLYTRLRQFLSLHFQGTWGAFPRAMRQLSVLNEQINTIRMVEQQPPDLQAYREQFEHHVKEARAEIAGKLKTWQLPLLGQRLRSTIISLLVVIALAVIVVVGMDWQTILTPILGTPTASFQGLSGVEDKIVLGIKVVLVLLLIGVEWFYLAVRNRALRRERQRIHRQLCQTVQGHLAGVGAVIAARVALALLQGADLYEPGEKVSPYERRLQALELTLEAAYKQAAHQQAVADTRIKRILGQFSHSEFQDYPWLGLSNRKDILAWPQLEEALLRSCSELASNGASANLFTEMLLRQLGTESPAELLEDMLNKQRWIAQNSDEVRFHAMSTLLVTLLLSLDTVRPEVTEVVPLLKQYVALQELFVQGPSAGDHELLDLASMLKGAMLERVLERNTRLTIQQDVLSASLLASWVGRQRYSDPQLAQMFASNEVLDRLAGKTNISQVLDALRGQGKLMGYPDEIAGDDCFYLFLAPGEASRTLMQTFDPLHDAQVHPELYPDGEKLVYMHIHRIRQLLPAIQPPSLGTKDARRSRFVASSESKQTLLGRTETMPTEVQKEYQ